MANGLAEPPDWTVMIMAHSAFPKYPVHKGLNAADTIVKLVGGHFCACHRYERLVYIADIEVFGQSHPHVHIRPIAIALIKRSSAVECAAPHHDGAPDR